LNKGEAKMNWHVLSADEQGNRFRVVFHIPIPAVTTNQAGILYRDALVEYLGGGAAIASAIPNLGSELTELQSGALYEHAENFYSNPNQSLAEKQTILDARYTQLVTVIQDRWQKVLEYWKYERDVP